MQFKAGYIIDAIGTVITDHKSGLDKNIPNDQTELHQINGLLQHVSSFDVEFPLANHNLNFTKIKPVLAVLNNIITRGLPTKAPVLLEQLFEAIGLTKRDNKVHEYNYPTFNGFDISYDTLFELLHIIEPNLEINRDNYGGNIGSHLEWKFIDTHPFLKQIIQSQRDFSTINPAALGNRSVDFSFTSPYLQWDYERGCFKNLSRIFEVDGPHHLATEYIYYDLRRDDLAAQEDFETLRFTTGDINGSFIPFENLINIQVYQNFKRNYEKVVETHLKEYTLVFTPLAIARIQKTLIEYFLMHPELFDERDKVTIAIIERDLPCGAIGVKCLQDMFENINAILKEDNRLKLPEIELTVFETQKWVISEELHLNVNRQDESFFNQNEFDIIIDHSILRRSNIYKEGDFKTDKAIKIRSSHYADNSFGKARRTYCAELLNYKALAQKQDDGSYKNEPDLEKYINYFIQNIFRKVGFKEGQLPIISRALQQKPVIGLLPTGGGKSLTYQLPGLLQPGLCLVVDPIKSLMQDQVRVLRNNWIDCCDFINSDLNFNEKRKKLIDFRYGEIQFLFVSPERLVMTDFRKIIKIIDGSFWDLAFSYCIIDEVHCVSEWGHDFRTSYLALGRNAQKHCKTKSGQVTLMGLTATASFDVLTDIERELKIEHDAIADSVITVDNTIRPELVFNFIQTTDLDFNGIRNDQTIKDLIGAKKQEKLNGSITNLENEFKSIDGFSITKMVEQHYQDFELDPTSEYKKEELKNKLLTTILKDKNNQIPIIIFCPHTTGSLGVTQLANEFPNNKEVFENLETDDQHKGFFIGGNEGANAANISELTQNYFIDFVEGKISHMVCTKAFGMGIDKSNIRAIFHINYSNSPESYIQEAGRAGRDGGMSLCTIIIDRNVFHKLSNKFIDLHLNSQQRRDLRNIIEVYSAWNNRIYPLSYFYDEKQNNDLTSKISALQLPFTLNKEIQDGIYEVNKDRVVHDYFHENNFKGIEIELWQIEKLFTDSFPLNNGVSFDEMFSQSDTTVFSFKIPALPTNDDLIRKIIADLNLPNLTLTYDNQPNQTVNAPVFLNTIYKSSSSFEDFISRIDENWPTLNIYNDVNYVSNRMIYVRMFYSKIGENDVSRIIYRLMCIHLIRDYTYDYNLNIFTCEIAKTNVENYINATQGFLKQYISNESASIKINQLKDSLNELDTLSAIKKCLRTILEFTYLEIVSKRKRAVDDLHKFIDDSINKADETTNNYSFKNFWYNHYFKEELYYYFNAKYARKGFKIFQKNYSLTDDTNEGRTSSWNVFDKYAAILNEQSSFISECKMMRGSCRRIWRSLTETDFKNEWVLKMLYSFATYGLNNEYYLKEANTNFCDSFRIYFFSISCNKSYKLFSEKISEYERLLIKSITNEVHIKYFKLTKQALMLEVHLDHVNSMLSYHQNKIKTFQNARL